MAEIQNNITNSTHVQFQLSANRDKLGTPVAGTIVFIKESKELYLDGVYYGLSTTDAAKLEKAVTDLGTLTGKVDGHLKLTQGLVDYVANLRKFADGAAVNSAEGPVLETSEGVLAGITNVKAAIKKLDEVVTTLNAHVWTAVNKPDNAGQFATSVTQKTNGSIEVDYADVKSTDVKRTEEQKAIVGGDTVEDALQTLKGNLDTTNQNVSKNASAIVTINGNGKGSISKAVSDAKDELIGLKPGVWAENEEKTLTHLKELISTLQRIDDNTADRLNAIVKELQDANGTETGIDLANTLLDKFLGLYGTPTDGNFRVNEKDVKKLQEIILEIEKEIGEKIGGAINGLNNTVRDNLTLTEEGNKKVVTVGHVGIEVVEEKGKLLSVDIVENDIASAQALTNLTSTVTNLSNKVEEHGRQLTWKVIS